MGLFVVGFTLHVDYNEALIILVEYQSAIQHSENMQSVSRSSFNSIQL